MLRLRLLDQFTTKWNSSETVKFPSHKSRALFAYLATERVPHTRIKLANLLWADSSDGNARNSVRVGLYRLRRLFDKLRPDLGRDLIKTDRTHVTLSPDLWCDVTQFQTLWQTIQYAPNAIDTLEKAVALYQSDFLSGFPAGVSENFDEWLQLTRQQLHTRAIQLFDQLLAHYLAQGHYEQLIPLAQQQIGLEAWHETAHLNLMFAHAHLGQIPEALRVYERCRTTLDHELGVAPSIELTRLADAIRSGTFANDGQSTPRLSNIRRQAQHN
ncbi:MAG: AfsR/SARP family transcriptional regulator, partial [Candidatus Promineifilaceae bacterium]